MKQAVKTVDQSVTSSTVLVADTDMQFAIGANETWIAEFEIRTIENAVGGHKIDVTAPVGCAGGYTWAFEASAGRQAGSTELAFGGGPLAITGSVSDITTLHVVARNGSTPGTITVVFAQAVSNASPATHKADSNMIAVRVG